MNIRMIVFGDDSTESYPKIESVITNSFTSVTGNDIAFPSVYNTVQSGLPEIAEALKSSNMLVLLADEKLYHEAKRSICKAFKFEMIHSEAVLQKINNLKNSERFMMHALIPKNATPFPLNDGLFPGFAVRSKNQCIFFLPFSEDRSFITMKKYVFPYIQRLYGEKLPDFSSYEIAYAADVLERQLLLSNVQIAISNTPFSKYIAHAAKKIDCFNEHISYAPYDEKKADRDITRLSAVSAADYYECRFGASVVEGEKDRDGNFTATITISDYSKAVVRVISSIVDESHEDFMNTVVTEFFLMLAQQLSSAPEDNEENKRVVKPSASIHGIRILIYVLLFAISFFLTYVATSFSDLSLFS